jgi:hypothetical protein
MFFVFDYYWIPQIGPGFTLTVKIHSQILQGNWAARWEKRAPTFFGELKTGSHFWLYHVHHYQFYTCHWFCFIEDVSIRL